MATVTDKEYYMDLKLKLNLDILKKEVKKDWSFIILVSGNNRVRIGKTTMAQQIAYYMDPTFSFDAVTFDPSDVRKISLKRGKTKVVFYDEARAGLDSKRAMENMQKDLIDFLTQAGQLNQILIIVLPDFFELKREIALSQSICLINCYTPKMNFFDRGLFAFYNLEQKQRLYYWGKKQGGNYLVCKPDFNGRFSDYQVLDKKKYEDLKYKSLLEGRKSDPRVETEEKIKRWENKARRYLYYRNKLIKYCNNMKDSRQEEIAKVLNITPTQVYRIVSRKQPDLPT
tara:strand:+ start:3186 stop:4040 length:855 start_codon:yes stop_codon:yes gene_type:complete